jgi:hypothetical protein
MQVQAVVCVQCVMPTDCFSLPLQSLVGDPSVLDQFVHRSFASHKHAVKQHCDKVRPYSLHLAKSTTITKKRNEPRSLKIWVLFTHQSLESRSVTALASIVGVDITTARRPLDTPATRLSASKGLLTLAPFAKQLRRKESKTTLPLWLADIASDRHAMNFLLPKGISFGVKFSEDVCFAGPGGRKGCDTKVRCSLPYAPRWRLVDDCPPR